MTTPMRNPAKHFARGLSLIELMVALVIGALLMAGAVTVFVQSRNTYRANDTVSRMQEAGRYALDVISPDVRLAGFWGLTNRPMSWTTTAAAVTNDCMANFAVNIGVPIEGRDANATGGSGYNNFTAGASKCAAATVPKVVTPATWSDILVVRRVGADQAALENTRLQVQSNRETLVLFSDGARPAGYNAAPQSETHNLITDLYYIGETPPVNGVRQYALRRQTLVAGPQMRDDEIMPGVQDMQVQFGLDVNGDGTVERYVNPEDAIPAGARIATVQLWLLVVSDEIEVGFADTNRAYTYANASQSATMFHDNRRRVLVTKTIQIRNSVS
jgi:type IV pilus assembly protein PilW